MNINLKQVGKESIIILVFVLLISVVYNYFNPKGINIFEKPNIISDTVLEKIVLSIDSLNNSSANLTNQNDDVKSKDNISSLKSENKINPTHNESTKPIEQIEDASPLEITFQQMKKLLAKPNVIIIDARSNEEFKEGHINGAINIFAYEEDLDKYFQNLTQVPMDSRKIIVVYCEGGTCDASYKVATDLIRLGHKNVFVYTGGWEEWSKQQ